MRLNDSQMKDWKWFDIWFGLYISTTGQTPIRLTPAWFQKETHRHTGEEPTRKGENPPVFSCRRGCRAPLGFWRILILHLTEHQRDALSVFIRGSQQRWDMPISLCLSLSVCLSSPPALCLTIFLSPPSLSLSLSFKKRVSQRKVVSHPVLILEGRVPVTAVQRASRPVMRDASAGHSHVHTLHQKRLLHCVRKHRKPIVSYLWY